MKQYTATTLALSLTLVLGGIGSAAMAQTAGERLQNWKSKTLDERTETRLKARDQFNQLPPEEQEAAKARAQSRYESMATRAKTEWNSLTPEEQEAVKTYAHQRGQTAVENTQAYWNGLSAEEQAAAKSEAEASINTRKEWIRNRQSQ